MTRVTLASRTILIAALLGGLGCGSDDPAVPDAAPAADSATADAPLADAPLMRGSASITGTIAETNITPVSVFAMTHPLGNLPILVMHEDPAAFCEVTDSSEHVIVIGFQCAPAAVGTRNVADVEEIDCKNAVEDWILVEGFSGEFSEYIALSGQVTIDSVDDTITGSFDANFGIDDDLAGTFEAVICP